MRAGFVGNRSGCFGESRGIARAEDERSTFCREFFGDSATKAATGGGDEGYFVFESEIHDLFLP